MLNTMGPPLPRATALYKMLRRIRLRSLIASLLFIQILLACFFDVTLYSTISRRRSTFTLVVSSTQHVAGVSYTERRHPRILILSELVSNKHKVYTWPTLLVKDSNRTASEVETEATDNISEKEGTGLKEFKIPGDQSMCVPMKTWQTTPRPTCNMIHEIDLLRDQAKLLGTGGWRGAWKIPGRDTSQDFVMKTIKLDARLFNESTFSRHFIDAAISEQLTFSPHVVDIYGFCAHAALNELAELAFNSVITKKRRRKKRALTSKESLQKLRYATQVALAVADLHNFDGERNATAVYKDLKPPNIRLTSSGMIKISDFNDAEMLQWNTTSNTQCRFRRKRWIPTYHSPEEVWENPLTERVDVYALGGVIYYILTGKDPYHDKTKAEAFYAVAVGNKPELSHEIKATDDPAIQFLESIMNECMTYNDTARPDSRYIANAMVAKLHSLQLELGAASS